MEVQREIDVYALRNEHLIFGGRIRSREWIASGKTQKRIGETTRRRVQRDLIPPRRSIGSKGVLIIFRSIKKDTVGGANCLLGASGRVPHQPDAGREVQIAVTGVGRRDSRVAVKEQSRRRVRVLARLVPRDEIGQ